MKKHLMKILLELVLDPDCLEDEQFFPEEEEEGNYKSNLNSFTENNSSFTDSKNHSTKRSEMDIENNNTISNKYGYGKSQVGRKQEMDVDNNCYGNSNEKDTSQSIWSYGENEMRQNKNYFEDYESSQWNEE
ncbi:hypothetical protein RFI_17010 [Reticulomyxa filosa]|uniref:Uncharacterized protein n=1 Tax=Reticulomyxa filosa TaxID=46433 RepID=X6N4F6_RETFI|nr:hypothetical protein RFI_17010 [Reticulomyxa filosa]|eukprot:ETO20207.1 hypothetical protein RFI_17010 [Reticulomyxa filosa]